MNCKTLYLDRMATCGFFESCSPFFRILFDQIGNKIGTESIEEIIETNDRPYTFTLDSQRSSLDIILLCSKIDSKLLSSDEMKYNYSLIHIEGDISKEKIGTQKHYISSKGDNIIVYELSLIDHYNVESKTKNNMALISWSYEFPKQIFKISIRGVSYDRNKDKSIYNELNKIDFYS